MSHHSVSYVNEKLTNNEGDEPKLGLNKQELRIKKNKHGTKSIFTRRTYLNLSLIIIIQISQSAVQMLNNWIKRFTKMEREIYCTLFWEEETV
jgi:hypothetical protein